MSTITRHGDKCTVTQISSNRKVDAEVMQFNEGRKITVVVNKSVKMLMNWNGRAFKVVWQAWTLKVMVQQLQKHKQGREVK